MNLSKSKLIACFLWISCLGVSVTMAQNNSSFYSWQHQSFISETASLSMSNAALMQFINPAVGGENQRIQFTSNIGSTTPYSFNEFNYSPSLATFRLAYSLHQHSVSLSADHFSFDIMNQKGNRQQAFRLHYGYQLNQRFSIGVGTGLNKWYMPEMLDESSFGGYPERNASNLFVDAGIYYEGDWSGSDFLYKPVLGVSVNNVGRYFELEMGNVAYYSPQATQLRWSMGLQSETQSEWRGRSWIGTNVYLGFNKYFARNNDNPTDKSHGLVDLFKNWGSYEVRSYPTSRVSARDQIATGIGVEFVVLQTVSLRYGVMSGAERWVRSQRSMGFGLDFNYFTFNVTKINYRSDANWDTSSENLFYEISVNLPITLFSNNVSY